jgi:hypothetical protein
MWLQIDLYLFQLMVIIFNLVGAPVTVRYAQLHMCNFWRNRCCGTGAAKKVYIIFIVAEYKSKALSYSRSCLSLSFALV